MVKILLIRPYFVSPGAIPTFPLGLAYLGASLLKSGHNVKILDLPALKIKNDKAIELIERIKPDLIGITALSYYYPEMVELCHQIKNYPIVLGGVHVSVLPELSLKQTNADYLIIGEGERTIVELANYIEQGGDLTKIKGLAFKKDGHIIINERRPPIKNIDEIPFPAWNLLNLKLYNPPNIREFNMFFNPNPALPIFTSRGCPYKCKYCASTNFWGPSIRFRSVKNIIEEIEYNMKHFNINSFEIWDDNFTLKRDRIIKFCVEIIKRNLKLSFYLPNGVRADTLDRSLIKIMKLAGFKGIIIAPESGSQKILNNMNKNLNLKVVKKIARILQEERILTSAYFIIGLPGETVISAFKTIKFGASLPLNGISYFIFTPLPGSLLFKDWCKKVDLESIDWKFDYFVYQKKKKIPLCNLTFKQLKKFQKLGYLYFFLKLSNLIRFLKRVNLKNMNIFLLIELRNLFFLIFKRLK
ncbi:MAG: B12-binding domain-containing radical SAM protein [Promethearchaeia archaeon]